MKGIYEKIWLLFFSLAILGLVFLIYTISSNGKNRYDTLVASQTNQVMILENTFNSLLNDHETILDILSMESMEMDFSDKEADPPPIFQKILNRNSAIAALGVLNKEGDYLYISNNADPTRLPNLKEQEESRETFQKTLESEQMVLGRTC